MSSKKGKGKKNKNLLELVMIVKNSGEEIIPMLEAAKKWIDHWTILDTGSTDDTMKNITTCLKGIPGQLHDGKSLYDDPFVDFSTARNRALDLAGTKCTFSIMLDDTYHITDGDALRKFLKKKQQKKEMKACQIIIEDHEKQYLSLRLLRTTSKLRYSRKIHEFVDISTNTTAPGVIKDIETGYMSQRSEQRKESDIRLMKQEIDRYPEDRRMRLHLATYLVKSDPKEAHKLLREIMELSTEKDSVDYQARVLLVLTTPRVLHNADEIRELCQRYPKEPEPAYLMAVVHKELGELDAAYAQIMKAAGYTSQISQMQHKYIRDYEIPYLFADICIQQKNYRAAEKIIKKYLPQHGDTRLLNMVYSISNVPQSGETLETPIVVFHATDNVEGWNPKDFSGKGGRSGSGSEIMCANMAKQLAKMGFRVFVFGKFEKEGMYNTQGMYDGVQYMDSAFYQQFIETYVVNVLIVLRDTNNMLYHNNVKKVFLWVHDVIPTNSLVGKLLNVQYDPKRFKKVLCLCNWHKKAIHQKGNIDKTKIMITRNAIDPTKYSRQPKKIPYRFIYASSADRGLEHLLELIPRVHDEFPETTLHVFTDLASENRKGNNQQLIDMIDALPYVTTRGRVSQEEIAYEYSISDVWFYPTDFTETYCITALEAQAAGCLCVCTGLSSLPEIVGNRGIVIGDHINDEGVKDEMVRELLKTLRDKERKKEITTRAREWAMQQSYKSLAEEWKTKVFCL
jgi:glycosyltransferase involved in cell wall biosynthesis